MGKTKEITAGVLGCCCVAWAETDTPPLKVTVSVRRRKGGCCCPWRVSSTKVAVFNFVKVRRDPVFGSITSRKAVLDVAPLLKYYHKDPHSSLVEVRVECLYKEHLVGLADLEEFLVALMPQSGPEEFLLLIDDGKFVVQPFLSIHRYEDEASRDTHWWNIIKVAKPSRLYHGTNVCETGTAERNSLSDYGMDKTEEEDNEVIQQDTCEMSSEENEITDDDMESVAVQEDREVTADTCEVNNDGEIIIDVCGLNSGTDEGEYKDDKERSLEELESAPYYSSSDEDSEWETEEEIAEDGHDNNFPFKNPDHEEGMIEVRHGGIHESEINSNKTNADQTVNKNLSDDDYNDMDVVVNKLGVSSDHYTAIGENTDSDNRHRKTVMNKSVNYINYNGSDNKLMVKYVSDGEDRELKMLINKTYSTKTVHEYSPGQELESIEEDQQIKYYYKSTHELVRDMKEKQKTSDGKLRNRKNKQKSKQNGGKMLRVRPHTTPHSTESNGRWDGSDFYTLRTRALIQFVLVTVVVVAQTLSLLFSFFNDPDR